MVFRHYIKRESERCDFNQIIYITVQDLGLHDRYCSWNRRYQPFWKPRPDITDIYKYFCGCPKPVHEIPTPYVFLEFNGLS